MDRLVAVLPHVGDVGPLPGDPRRSEEGRRGEEAVRRRARRCSSKIIDGKLLARARDLRLLRRRTREGDDLVDRRATRFPMLRQQEEKDVCLSLADFVAPNGPITSARSSSPRASASTSSPARSRRRHDDYSAIMVKALADRLAEAAAEWLHHRVRVEWGYGATEASSHDQILAEKYRGIRPAFGYPACPDHTPKGTLFALLDNAQHHGVRAHRELRDARRPPRSRACTSRTPTRATSRSAASPPTRRKTTRGASACRETSPCARCRRSSPRNAPSEPRSSPTTRRRPRSSRARWRRSPRSPAGGHP